MVCLGEEVAIKELGDGDRRRVERAQLRGVLLQREGGTQLRQIGARALPLDAEVARREAENCKGLAREMPQSLCALSGAGGSGGDRLTEIWLRPVAVTPSVVYYISYESENSKVR